MPRLHTREIPKYCGDHSPDDVKISALKEKIKVRVKCGPKLTEKQFSGNSKMFQKSSLIPYEFFTVACGV